MEFFEKVEETASIYNSLSERRNRLNFRIALFLNILLAIGWLSLTLGITLLAGFKLF